MAIMILLLKLLKLSAWAYVKFQAPVSPLKTRTLVRLLLFGLCAFLKVGKKKKKKSNLVIWCNYTNGNSSLKITVAYHVI